MAFLFDKYRLNLKCAMKYELNHHVDVTKCLLGPGNFTVHRTLTRK